MASQGTGFSQGAPSVAPVFARTESTLKSEGLEVIHVKSWEFLRRHREANTIFRNQIKIRSRL